MPEVCTRGEPIDVPGTRISLDTAHCVYVPPPPVRLPRPDAVVDMVTDRLP